MCSHDDWILDDGYNVCTSCGKVMKVALNTELCSYTHTPRHYIIKPYSRKSRFFKKCLAMLRCMVQCKVNEKLLKFLQTKRIETPEDLFQKISEFPTKRRRPYDSVMFYWVALGHKQPHCTDTDVEQLKRDFDDIFFAWHRLGFQRPRFPYSFLFRKIVQRGGKKYTHGMHQLTRFVRQLSCEHRRKRYDQIFQKCASFDYKMHQPLPRKPPKQTVTKEFNHNPKSLSVHGIKNVYKSYEEMQRAIDTDNFDISKMFHIDKNGNFYILSYGDVSVPHVQLQNSQSEQLLQTQKLDQLLHAQSLAP